MTGLSKTSEVVIIGGGVIGLAVARALALKGVRDVTVIERASFGAESSSAAAGMLAPQAEAERADRFFQLCCHSRDLYPEFADSLREESGIDIELDATGTLYLAFTEEDEKEVQRRFEWQSEAGLAVELLDAVDASVMEPAISSRVRAALRFPRDIQVENRRLISALVGSNQVFGVHLMSGTTAQSVTVKNGRVAGIQTSGGFVRTENVVIASGAWSSQLELFEDPAKNGLTAGQLKPDKAQTLVRIEPVRGQMLCFDATPQICRHVIYSPRGYIVPRRDGRLLAGSTTENVGFDKRVSAQGVFSILSAALEIAPRVGTLGVADLWAGLRPHAADDLPVLGPCAEIDGIFYATGHYRNGILLAPITGALIAQAIVDGVTSPMIETFSPDRFDLVSKAKM